MVTRGTETQNHNLEDSYNSQILIKVKKHSNFLDELITTDCWVFPCFELSLKINLQAPKES